VNEETLMPGLWFGSGHGISCNVLNFGRTDGKGVIAPHAEERLTAVTVTCAHYSKHSRKYLVEDRFRSVTSIALFLGLGSAMGGGGGGAGGLSAGLDPLPSGFFAAALDSSVSQPDRPVASLLAIPKNRGDQTSRSGRSGAGGKSRRISPSRCERFDRWRMPLHLTCSCASQPAEPERRFP